MSDFEVVIGIEVHAQLKTSTKLFCGCAVRFGDTPNSNVCPVCLGLPGALPVLNKKSVELAILAGLSLSCDVRLNSVFSRKNYFYPDLPKGYQISQFDKPICLGGHLDVRVGTEVKRIGITRIHMEEDAGKLLHQGADAIAGATHSLVDLNRACVPLIEIVSEPDIRSPQEARAYVEQLAQLLEYLDICSANLEEGSLRADANVSLRKKGTVEFGTKTEIKNLNSFRSIERAIVYEIKRQEALLVAGEKVIQQTRHYDDATQTTKALRSKEEAHDYRYFPEPDLLPLIFSQDLVDRIKEKMPETPDQKRGRFRSEYELSNEDCDTLLNDRKMLAYYEAVLGLTKGLMAKECCRWLLGDLNALLKQAGVEFSLEVYRPEYLIQLVELISSGKISGKMAKEVLANSFGMHKSPVALVEETGATQLSDTSALLDIIKPIVDAHPEVIEKYKGGRTNAADFLIGQVMKQTKGQAKPDLVRSLLIAEIEAR